MDVNRGDRAVSITSIGTPALGLAAYRKEHMPPGDPSWKESYIGADRTISLVQTAKGRVIRLEHDVSSPHPYSRTNSLGGTRGGCSRTIRSGSTWGCGRSTRTRRAATAAWTT